jgi:hypothetical protein
MTITQLQAKLARMVSDIETAMTQAEKSWLLREIASTEERIKYSLKSTTTTTTMS